MDCRLLNFSASGLAVETDVGMRLGVPYPFRLRHDGRSVSIEAEVRWCRLVRNERSEAAELRPVYRAGAAFVDWRCQIPVLPEGALEQEIGTAVDRWIESSRTTEAVRGAGRKIVRHSRFGRRR